MFTAENFRRIFDRENRKGIDLANRFIPKLEPHTFNVKSAVAEIKALRSNHTTNSVPDFDEKLATLKANLARHKLQKSTAIDEALDEISARVHEKSFRITLSEKFGPLGKPIFCIDGTPETFFVVKQLQQNIKSIYGVKPASRHDLASRVRETLNTKYPFKVIRTDISSFYESVDRDHLLSKLDADQLLSASSKRFIQQILSSYGRLTGNTAGLPRGVGISAYLAELYLRPIDRRIGEIDGLVLYSRYVDDIVAVFSRPPTGSGTSSYKDDVLGALSEWGLKHNPEKTTEVSIGAAGPNNFDYLGYNFRMLDGKCQTSPSAAKIARYKQRLKLSFDEYEARASISSRRAYRDLVSRVKFLTGNTRLVNSKSNAVTGIYYNNSIISDLSRLAQLDDALNSRIASLRSENLKLQLRDYGFIEGFSNRRFHRFNTKELKNIVRAWKHV